MMATIMTVFVYILASLMLIAMGIMVAFDVLGYFQLKKDSLIEEELLTKAMWTTMWRRLYKFLIIEAMLVIIILLIEL